jgi:hypothetical protein
MEHCRLKKFNHADNGWNTFLNMPRKPEVNELKTHLYLVQYKSLNCFLKKTPKNTCSSKTLGLYTHKTKINGLWKVKDIICKKKIHVFIQFSPYV